MKEQKLAKQIQYALESDFPNKRFITIPNQCGMIEIRVIKNQKRLFGRQIHVGWIECDWYELDTRIKNKRFIKSVTEVLNRFKPPELTAIAMPSPQVWDERPAKFICHHCQKEVEEADGDLELGGAL